MEMITLVQVPKQFARLRVDRIFSRDTKFSHSLINDVSIYYI